jgi:uncharacterized protein YodC (DUF2158 family)
MLSLEKIISFYIDNGKNIKYNLFQQVENKKMDKKINLGDVVELKSCGPDMTVTKINDSEHYECGFFDSLYVYKTYVFHPMCLTLVEKE